MTRVASGISSSREATWQRWANDLAIGNPDVEGDTTEYWRQHAARGGPIEPLKRPCQSCAVVEGFYTGLTYDLARQPPEIVKAVCGNWFCHNHPDRACAGNIEFIAWLLRDSDGSPQGGGDFGSVHDSAVAKPIAENLP